MASLKYEGLYLKNFLDRFDCELEFAIALFKSSLMYHILN